MTLLKAESILLRYDLQPEGRYVRHRLGLARFQSLQEAASINILTQPQLYLQAISFIVHNVLNVPDNGFLLKKKSRNV